LIIRDAFLGLPTHGEGFGPVHGAERAPRRL